MIKLTSILCILCLYCVSCDVCVLDNGSQDLNTEKRLHKDLQCNHDIFQSPQNTTIVKVRFRLKHFHFDKNEEIFNMYSWLFLAWTDDRLTWDPKNYDGILETTLSMYQIWVPSMKHQTAKVVESFDHQLNSDCQATYLGRVTCVWQLLSQTECNTNLTNWPYDTQSCTFKFGAYTSYKDNVVFTFNYSKGISMFGAEYGPGWNIMDFDRGETNNSDTQFYLTFVVERQAESLGSITIFPSIVLLILTVSTMFLDVGITRVGLEILSLLCHIYIKTFINVSIPKHDVTSPLILHFLTISIAVTTVILLLTFALGSLVRKKDPPPQMVVALHEFIFKSPIRFLIWPRWVTSSSRSGADNSVIAKEVWVSFANIINSASIVIAVIVYLSIFLCFIPKPT